MPVQMYLQCDELKGSVTTLGFEEHIQVDSVTFKTQRQGHHEGEYNRLNMSHFIVTKRVDKAAVSTLKSNTSGSRFKEVKIKFIRPTNDKKIKPFLTYILNDVYIADYELLANDQFDDPIETIAFSYQKITLKYCEASQSGHLKSQEVMSYSLETGTSSGE